MVAAVAVKQVVRREDSIGALCKGLCASSGGERHQVKVGKTIAASLRKRPNQHGGDTGGIGLKQFPQLREARQMRLRGGLLAQPTLQTFDRLTRHSSIPARQPRAP
jgi:hypothetical protein